MRRLRESQAELAEGYRQTAEDAEGGAGAADRVEGRLIDDADERC